MPNDYLAGLNSGQMEAVLHREGPMLVTAGPGSGKTHVIITRLMHMILEYKVPPEKILVITFTKEAAKSMSSRFQRSFSESSVSFGTFHSFYYQIIRSIPLYSKYRLIYENEKKYILSQLITATENEDAVDTLLRSISFYKNTLDLASSAKIARMEEEQFKVFLKKYNEELIKRKCMDFDDMLYLCLKLLQEDKNLLCRWQKMYDYYLVDEFQDCNPVQYAILKMLTKNSDNDQITSSVRNRKSPAGNGNNLFVVGDDDQAIYGFRGAESMILQRFLEDFPEAARVSLGINYRCASSIVKASSKIISDNSLRLRKKLISNNIPAGDEKVTIHKWYEKSEMYQYICSLFKTMSENDLSDHAVLFRTNMETQMFAAQMLKSNIPFQIKDKNISIYEHFLVKDIMAFMQAAQGNRERKIFLRILNKPRTNIGREALEDDLVDFEKLKAFYSNKFINMPEAVLDIEHLEHNLDQLKKMPLFLGIRYIRLAMNYERYLLKRAEGNEALFHSWLELLEWLQENAASFRNLEEWTEYQEKYKKKINTMSSKDTILRNDLKSSVINEELARNRGVHLMTMHASKGLEFKHCYILNVNEGIIPKYQKGQKLTKEELEEERRIFYVGMTRAEKTLELHYLTGTKERPKFPSRFIQKLMDRYEAEDKK